MRSKASALRVVRQGQSYVLKAGLARLQERSAATPKHQPWRGYSPDDEHSNHPPNLAQPGMGCKAGKGRGRNKPRPAIATLESARENVWTDPSRLSYDDSRTVRRGQGDAWSELQKSKRGEMGTGARGAPVPEVGLYVKIKRAPFRSLGSRLNEGHVSSPGWLNRRQKTDRTGRPARGGQ